MKGKRTMNKSNIHKTILVITTVLLAGCAVLTVDVDVYKGPLANHKDIQTEQMAAMAIAAKPLLVELRDVLEVHYFRMMTRQNKPLKCYPLTDSNEYQEWKHISMEKGLYKLRKKDWYEPEYVRPYPKNDKKVSCFEDSSANNVNNILFLYKDCESQEYMELIDEVKAIIRRYKKSYAILYPNEPNISQNKALEMQDVKNNPQYPKAYLDCQKALEDLWLSTMNGIIYINTLPVSDGNELKRRKKLTDGIVDFSLEIIQPRRLAVLLEAVKKDSNAFSNEVINLANFIPDFPKPEPNIKNINWGFEHAKWLLGGKLKKDPVQTAAVLKEIHTYSKDGLRPDELSTTIGKEGGYLDNLRDKEGWKFGLVRAPFEELVQEKEDTPEQLSNEVTKAFAREGGAFGGGRLDKGLERLIEEYLNIAEKNRFSNDSKHEHEIEEVRQTLSDALVRFAQKLLFLANYGSFISPPKNPGIIPGIFDALSRGLIGDIRTDEGKWIPQAGKDEYKRILQAVGNSILVQADALRQERVHTRELERRKDTEIAAIQRTLDKSGEELLDRFLKTLEADLRRKKTISEKTKAEKDKAKELLDELKKKSADVENELKPITAPEGGTYVDGVKNIKMGIIAAYDVLVKPKGELERKYSEQARQELDQEINTAKDCAAKLAEKLNSFVGSVDVTPTKDRLENAAAYLEKTKFSDQNIGSLSKAYDQIIAGVIKEYSYVQALLNLAQKAVDAAKEVERQKKVIKTLVEKMTLDTADVKSINQAIAVVREAKNVVLQKIDRLGVPPSGVAVYDMLHVALQEQKNGELEQGIQYALTVLKRIKPIDLKKRDLKLPKNPTAKDVRDFWITLLEYEHDLALRDGLRNRAEEIMEAIKAAREKREGMIFIRPAMAYLRTSFPATSLQGNPNLSWDNMLGDHMTRSIPFARQIGEFLNPDTKRDALITAEIDKQFWQNINRVRVAGGGFTNYAVVKDDIGNWYVKGYSANPNDIIQSTKNLALYTAGAQMGTDLLNAAKQTDDAQRETKSSSSGLQRVFEEYRDEYRKRTKREYLQLHAMLHDPDTKVDDRIRALWEEKMDVNAPIQEALEEALNWSHEYFLKSFASKLKKDEKDPARQRELIVEGIRSLKQFRNDLTWKITNLKNRMERENSSYRSSSERTKNEKIQSAQKAAKAIVKKVVDGMIHTLLSNRKDAMKIYEDALTILVKTTGEI